MTLNSSAQSNQLAVRTACARRRIARQVANIQLRQNKELRRSGVEQLRLARAAQRTRSFVARELLHIDKERRRLVAARARLVNRTAKAR